MTAPLAPVQAGPPASASAHIGDQATAPLVSALDEARGTDSFHCPGHKSGRAVDSRLAALVGTDLFAADVWLGPTRHDRVLAEAQRLAAAAWGADAAFFLGGGSSSGNVAALLATLSPGDEVLVSRDLHTSTLTGIVLAGARPVFVTPTVHPEQGVALGVEPAALAAALDEHPAAALVSLVSPSYHGVCGQLRELVHVAHARGVPVHVDEAWGAHLPFHPDLPLDALAAGADVVVTSPHKMLSALSQASVLLAQGPRVPVERVARAVQMTQSTSPLVPLLASIDAARRQMVLAGRALLGDAIELAGIAAERIARIPGLRVLDALALGLPRARRDPLKITVDVTGRGLTGVIAEQALRESGVAVEGCDLRTVFLVVTAGDDRGTVDRLVAALGALPEQAWSHAAVAPPPPAALLPGPLLLTPREAFFAPSVAVPLAASLGRVCAELVTPYPPGIPVLVPGEVVTGDKLDHLREFAAAGLHLHGCADPRLRTLRVVRSGA
ncbi:MAG: aminotransferase class V-fold PLP-dependent enzyme [Actinomycetota bacterium]|nr:aminotransferase class V-fold PLP-dependent enzyme [Actinomycetota bacterium]